MKKDDNMPYFIRLSPFDNAANGMSNENQWNHATEWLSKPEIIFSDNVRETIRSRARYESENNSYVKGIVDSLTNNLVGTGPRLNVYTGSNDRDNEIEDKWEEFLDTINLTEKLRLMKRTQVVDGEVFAIIADDGEEFIFMPVSTEYVQNLEDEPIKYDKYGRPVKYFILKKRNDISYDQEGTWYDAENIIHLFKTSIIGQQRGVSELTPSLGIWTKLRRFSNAVLSSAENVARISAIMTTNTSARKLDQNIDFSQVKQLDIPTDGGLLFVPSGWGMSQIKPEQPSQQYQMFIREQLKEACRCLSIPYGVASGDSSDYNYASGRLDMQNYTKSIKIERTIIEKTILSRIFTLWSPTIGIDAKTIIHDFYWDGIMEHQDPSKEANAAEKRIKMGLLSPQEYFSSEGKDWLKEQQNMAESLGLTLEEYRENLKNSIFGIKEDKEEIDVEEETKPTKKEKQS
jgi:capsid protein